MSMLDLPEVEMEMGKLSRGDLSGSPKDPKEEVTSPAVMNPAPDILDN